MKRLLLVAILNFSCIFAFAKDLRISGVVVDSIGSPLAYTDILLKGSNLKIMSDVNGKFDISVKRLQRITFLWCNYKPIRTRYLSSKEIKVTMSINKSYITVIK